MADVPPRHSAARYNSYFAAHYAVLGKHHGFVCGDALTVTEFQDFIVLEGEIGCLGQIVIAVYKILDVVGVAADRQRIIKTSSYSYNVFLRGGHNIFRYDNNHADNPYPGHETPHHKHEFDWQTGDPIPGTPRCIGDDWPVLGEVITEASDWYYRYRDQLPYPNDCADNLQSEIVR